MADRESGLKRFWQRIQFPIWTVPVALLFLCAISYGAMASRLGFYWDDWFVAYYIHFLGPSSFPEAAAADRPLGGWLYVLTTGLLGESPLAWQIFGVVTRWLLCLALWWLLYALWPRKITQITSITLLFAIYPGFKQQYIAITWSNWFIVYALFLVSLGAMIWALRKRKWFWPLYLLAMALCILTFFAVEYFFGLELLRPVLLWLVLSETIADIRGRFRQVGLYWAPFALLNLLFLIYRISTPTPRGEITILDRLSTEPFVAALELGKTIARDAVTVSALAWKQVLDVSGVSDYGPVVILKYGLIVLGAALLTVVWLARLRVEPQGELRTGPGSQRRWARQAILLGAFGIFVGGVPFWATGLQIMLSFTRDRFTLPMALGTSILFVGLLELLTWRRLQSIVIVGVAVGLGAGLHFQTALTYRQEWLLQRDFFWQLAWRAPGIQPGTVVLTTDMPFVYDSDASLTAPLSWIYAPDNTSRQLPYLYFDLESHLTRGQPDLVEDSALEKEFRITPFYGSTSQMVAVIYQPPSCLKVIDPRLDRSLPSKPRFFRELLPFSRPELILPHADPAAWPASLFGPEPEHDWCYYFEKADLASQVGDWELVAELGDQALTGKQFYRRNVVELIPFIQGYAYTGRWDQAVELSLQAYQAWENMRLMLCEVWSEIHRSATLDVQGQKAFEQLQGTLQCAAP